ncbi:hypothetical protein [Malacoplasma iowae]|uniref:Uncharacterized protein n=1 Tax=Malacoplasma iowae 695 TaxID=1048830 RepID=A0A9J7BWL6_MALIO|nr:hypothetical protein [Malacoplasma iowae]UYS84741.1 hypothetical protein EER00_05405 [Malacoplasma iowae 695]
MDGSIREQHLKILKNKSNLMVVGSILYKSENWKEKVFELEKTLNS